MPANSRWDLIWGGMLIYLWIVSFPAVLVPNSSETRGMSTSDYRGSILLGKKGIRNTTKDIIPELYIGSVLFPPDQNILTGQAAVIRHIQDVPI